MVNEGLWWFQDLTVPGPWYGLPLATSALMIAGTKLLLGSGAANMPGNMAKYMPYLIGVGALMAIPIGSYQPSGVMLLWFTNSIFAMVQNAILQNAFLRSKLGLPQLVAKPQPAPSSGGNDVMAKFFKQLAQQLDAGSSAQTPATSAATTALQQAVATPPPPGTKLIKKRLRR